MSDTELPQKVGDVIEPLEPPARLSDSELAQLAVDVVEGRVFMTNTPEGIQWSFGLIVSMLDLRPIAEQVGALYEEMAKAGPTAINGFPFFTSMRMLHADDFPLYLAKVDEYEKQRQAFVDSRIRESGDEP